MSERDDLMLEILKRIHGDVSSIRRELTSHGVRLSAIEDHMRGVVTSIYGVQSDVSDLRSRVDRIEQRLGLIDFTH